MALSYPDAAGKFRLRYVKPAEGTCPISPSDCALWPANRPFPDWGRVAAFAQNSEDLILPMPRVLTELFGFDSKATETEDDFFSAS